MSDVEKEPQEIEQVEQPKKPKKTRDLREYLKSYYRNNKEKYVESNRRRREKLGLTVGGEKPDKFKLTIIDSDTCETLYTKTYKSQKEICEDLNLPAHKVCRIYKKKNSPNYIIEKI